VGLITGLLTFPLAPIRGTVWLAEMLEAQAAKQTADDESTILAGLAELEALRENGEVTDEEIEEAENDLLERLIVLRGSNNEESHGGF
jgi:hypothetical protein